MENGRFGPIEPHEKPRKTYKIDYNRLITFLMVVIIAVLALIIWKDARKQPAEAAPEIMNAAPPQESSLILAVQPTATPSPEELRPIAESEKLLPVFRYANTNQKRVAITVDELDNQSNIDTLLGLCATYGAKVTFFPTGTEIAKTAGIWPAVVIAGHEIENHTYANKRLQTMLDEDKTVEVRAQTNLLCDIIGSDYQPHFLRTDNLEDDYDELLHAWLKGNGYCGIARWDASVPGALSEIREGSIINYPLTSSGLKKLTAAMQVLSENGYEMVTLNELFLYPNNIESFENNG